MKLIHMIPKGVFKAANKTVVIEYGFEYDAKFYNLY